MLYRIKIFRHDRMMPIDWRVGENDVTDIVVTEKGEVMVIKKDETVIYNGFPTISFYSSFKEAEEGKE